MEGVSAEQDLSIEEAAVELGMSPTAVIRLLEAGQLPSHLGPDGRRRRILRSDLEAHREERFALRQQMTLAAARQAVASSNLANLNTPGYKAREADFGSALESKLGGDSLRLTNARHLPGVEPARVRPHDVGRYLVNVACLHCHQLKSEHDTGLMKTPALAQMVQGYRYDQFVTLLATGKPIGGREMPFMSKVAREAFAFYSEEERRAIYDYLVAQ